jgi:hypothetical protein
MTLAQTDTQPMNLRQTGPAQRALVALSAGKLPLPALLYLLAVVIPIGFNVGPLVLTLLRVFLLIMTLPLLGKLLAGRYGRVFLTDILFLCHILWAIVALSVNNPSQVVQQMGSVGIEFIGGYLVGRAYIRTPQDFIALCRWLAFLVLCTTPFALFEAKTGRPLLIELIRKLPGLTTVAIVSIDGRMGLERVQAVFAHPIHYGLFCSVAFSLAFVALRDFSSTAWRYVCSVVIAGSGFLALSSGALLAIVLQISLILWSSVFHRIKWRWWLLVGLFGVAYVVVDALSNRAPLQVFMSYATFSAHNAYWRGIIFEWGMKNLWANPIYGIGLNDWVRPWYMFSGSMDNFWLVMGVRYGIPGFVLLAAGYAWAIFLVMRRNFEASALLTQIRRAWVFTFLGLSFTLTTVHVWTNIYSFVFFMFGAGMWLIEAVAKPAAEGKPNVALPDRTLKKGLIYSRFAPRKNRQTVPFDPSD